MQLEKLKIPLLKNELQYSISFTIARHPDSNQGVLLIPGIGMNGKSMLEESSVSPGKQLYASGYSVVVLDYAFEMEKLRKVSFPGKITIDLISEYLFYPLIDYCEDHLFQIHGIIGHSYGGLLALSVARSGRLNTPEIILLNPLLIPSYSIHATKMIRILRMLCGKRFLISICSLKWIQGLRFFLRNMVVDRNVKWPEFSASIYRWCSPVLCGAIQELSEVIENRTTVASRISNFLQKRSGRNLTILSTGADRLTPLPEDKVGFLSELGEVVSPEKLSYIKVTEPGIGHGDALNTSIAVSIIYPLLQSILKKGEPDR